MARIIRTDPQGFHALRRHADRTGASWRPCPVFGLLIQEAEADVAASRRAIEAGRVAYAAELEQRREAFNAAWG